MALEGNIRLLERDIEDWLWMHPEILPMVDGWIDRQLPLNNNSILDMLGYKHHYDYKVLVLVELKSRPLKRVDILQIGKYQNYLQETIEDIGLISLNIWPVLIGVDTKPNRGLWECASVISAQLFNISIQDGKFAIDVVGYPWFEYKENAQAAAKTGKYDNLINFLIPEMPDFLQDKYRVEIKNES